MGTWDVGPFDNDTAADWCGDLDDAAPQQRAALIRDALRRVAEHGEEYLDSDEAVEAIAAAAVVASQLPGGTKIDTPYAPDFLLEGGTVEVAGDVPAIAVRALDRIVGDDSEWRELWEEAEESYPRALAGVRSIRDTLAQAITR
ncbi:DUF4259 domain-containing protein [Amorphoplanes digitatis]|uniref:DUF4259 domain-containing protein n=1 Tax=Actinoplanes digitatis TaxID=1868 RepID=A0A7W7HYX3_9ACTN|nr:DUF4259 domain-containing protein [Actinoplanes digitatis]MBB4763260.1 hypothetical protein [Actinoplanes digitatis]GID92079.1 hypothetical protein Adi01nite_14910 [Actinoplanes digitatis]